LDNQQIKQEAPAPEVKSIAERITRDAVKSDTSILAAVALDKNGYPVAISRSPALAPEDYLSQAALDKFGMVVTVFWGAAEGPERVIGRREFIVGAYRDQMIMVTSLSEYKMLLALRLSRSANIEHVYLKLANLLGLAQGSVSG
jgi:hypothetical protein